MRFHSIEIRNFRAIDHLRLDDLPETGVVVIEGDNEQGKSSILEAILTVLTESHKTSKQAVRALQPVDRDVAVIIRLELTVGPVRLVISKQFLKQKSAELQIITPRRENYTGEQAESQLTEILESHLDRSLLDALFMRQGNVQASINAVGIPSLTSALNSRDGTGDDPPEDTELMAAVDAEYARYYSIKTGKESKGLAAFGDEVQNARAELDDARAAVSTLISQVERVARLELERTGAREKLPLAEEELASRRHDLEVATALKAAAEESIRRHAQAETEHRAAVAALSGRTRLRERAAAAESALAAARSGLGETATAAEREAALISEREATLTRAREREAEAVAALGAARSTVAALRATVRREELAAIIETVDGLDAEIRSLQTARASRVTIDEADIDAVQRAVDEVRVLTALRLAHGGHIDISAREATLIEIDGADTEIGETVTSLDLDRGYELTIGEVELRVTPGRSVEDSRVELEAAEADLAELLDRFGVDGGIGELRSLHRAQLQQAAELEALDQRRTAASGGADVDALRAELAVLSDNHVGVTSELGLEEADAALTEAETQRERAGGDVTLADAALDALRQRPAERELTIARTRIEGLAANAEAVGAEVADAEAGASDEQLRGDVDKRRGLLDAAAAARDAAVGRLEDRDLDLIEQLLDGALANVDSYTCIISDATTELVRLEGHIDLAAGAEERMSKAAAALEAAINRRDSELRRAHAARRLREVMTRHRDESRRRYAAPFADKLNRLAARVFGADTDFGLDDQLSVTSRSIGARTVDLDHLSGGAREQLAILTRFAIAELVADSSTQGGVPVFIDDALGSTDPERLRRISTLFSEAGRESQVFVLTCVPERYHFVAPKTVYHIDQLKQAGALGV
ncbi:AAA family ATPase [Corynebacterium pacaense]|uniref:AAA family ATPase n=1 Tax=Corynebacterium pacaense TaxID=1816684 RepID=UPI0009B9492A|nr:AAA family ATPase [Corynebacterium pacaense]